MASGSPTRAFMSVDLPALGAPARATKPQRDMGEEYRGPAVPRSRQLA